MNRTLILLPDCRAVGQKPVRVLRASVLLVRKDDVGCTVGHRVVGHR